MNSVLTNTPHAIANDSTPPPVQSTHVAPATITKESSTSSKAQAAATPQDSVHLSATAQALQEATETAAQTAKEASSGDGQARRLLERESQQAER